MSQCNQAVPPNVRDAASVILSWINESSISTMSEPFISQLTELTQTPDPPPPPVRRNIPIIRPISNVYRSVNIADVVPSKVVPITPSSSTIISRINPLISPFTSPKKTPSPKTPILRPASSPLSSLVNAKSTTLPIPVLPQDIPIATTPFSTSTNNMVISPVTSNSFKPPTINNTVKPMITLKLQPTKSIITIAIIGSAGKVTTVDNIKYSLNNVNPAIYMKMINLAEQYVQSFRDDNPNSTIHLYSGGAAWSDQVAVHLYLQSLLTNSPYQLTLYLPAQFDCDQSQYVDTGDNDWRKNPGRTSNNYHSKFSNALGDETGTISSKQIKKAIESGANVVVRPGFHARNSDIAKAKHLLAYGWFDEQPVSGGTADTWKKASDAERMYVDLKDMMTANINYQHPMSPPESTRPDHKRYTEQATQILRVSDDVLSVDDYQANLSYLVVILKQYNGDINQLLTEITEITNVNNDVTDYLRQNDDIAEMFKDEEGHIDTDEFEELIELINIGMCN